MYQPRCLTVFNLVQAIRDEAHKNFERALKTILRCAESPPKFYAKVRLTTLPTIVYDIDS